MAGFNVSQALSRMPSIKEQVDASTGRLGLALLGMGVGSVLAMPWTGALAQRYGSAAVVRVAAPVAAPPGRGVGFAGDPMTLTRAAVRVRWWRRHLGRRDERAGPRAGAARGQGADAGLHAGWSIGTVVGAMAGAGAAAVHLPLPCSCRAPRLSRSRSCWRPRGPSCPTGSGHPWRRAARGTRRTRPVRGSSPGRVQPARDPAGRARARGDGARWALAEGPRTSGWHCCSSTSATRRRPPGRSRSPASTSPW